MALMASVASPVVRDLDEDVLLRAALTARLACPVDERDDSSCDDDESETILQMTDYEPFG